MCVTDCSCSCACVCVSVRVRVCVVHPDLFCQESITWSVHPLFTYVTAVSVFACLLFDLNFDKFIWNFNFKAFSFSVCPFLNLLSGLLLTVVLCPLIKLRPHFDFHWYPVLFKVKKAYIGLSESN